MQPPTNCFLYDGQCGFCTAFVSRFARVLRRHGFEPVPLQEPWVSDHLQLPDHALVKDVRVLADGRQVAGADAYIFVAWRIWWAIPFAVLFSLPGLHSLLRYVYRRIADHRYCLGGTCRRI